MTAQAIPDLERLGSTGFQDSSQEFEGTRCDACGTSQLDEVLICLSCGSKEIRRASFGASGRLYSFSTIHASSYSPDPYTLAYVDLDDGPRVLGEVVGTGIEPHCDDRVVAVPSDRAVEQWAFQITRDEAK